MTALSIGCSGSRFTHREIYHLANMIKKSNHKCKRRKHQIFFGSSLGCSFACTRNRWRTRLRSVNRGDQIDIRDLPMQKPRESSAVGSSGKRTAFMQVNETLNG